MTLLAKISGTNVVQFPYTLADLRREVPGISFPDAVDDATLISYGVVRVTATLPPSYSALTHRVASTAALIDGQWQQAWNVVPLPEAQASSNIRAERNQRLTDCDWTQLPDAPVDPAPWAAYRQALRDISAQAGFPWDVAWPEVP